MTAAEIIAEIKRLPQGEQSRVFDFAREASASRRLKPEELGQLAERMVNAESAAEADRLQEEIVRGFYGDAHAKDPAR